MLRRSRVALPIAMAVAALLGAYFPQRVGIVVAVVLVIGALLDAWITRVEETRINRVADQVVAFASDEDQPPPIPVEGGREWRRLMEALNAVARVLRERFDQIRTARARVEGLLDAIPTAVMLFEDDELVYANPAAEEQFGFDAAASLSPDTLAMTPLRALGVVALVDALEEAQEAGGVVTVSTVRDDRQLLANATRLSDGEAAIIVTDLTEVSRVEAMRRDFVANASHELKTPVTGMQALAESLHVAMEKDPERARGMVERIQAESSRMAQLVRDLLDLARLEEPEKRATSRVDVAEIASELVERFASYAEDRGVTLSLKGDSDEAQVIGRRDDLHVALSNLIQNGIQYNQPGGEVVVSARRTASEVSVTVADTGIGIPATDQTRIFERFYRVDKARSREAGGTGLGLSLVRHAVESHGGQVRVDSVLGEGTIFHLTIPVDGGLG